MRGWKRITGALVAAALIGANVSGASAQSAPIAERRAMGPADGPLPAIVPAGAGRAFAGDVRFAFLTEPTDRYRHAVLGDGIEAGGLMVADGERNPSAPIPNVAWIRLSEPFVFEDVAPRVADLDGDGRNEIVTVLSERGRGASLAVLGLRDGALALIARTPPIGRANRWLNPAAIADFDRDGVADVALIETPHIGGELQLWSGASLVAGAPRMLAARRGYSNHAIGSPELDLTEIIETADGPVLIVPSADRRALEALRYADGEWRTMGRVVLDVAVAGPVGIVGDRIALGGDASALALGDLSPGIEAP